MPRSRRFLRTPALHFVVIGLVLFVADRVWTASETARMPERPRVVVIDDDRLAEIRSDFQDRYGSLPTAREEEAMIRLAVDEELLYREAIARGLVEGDRSIQWWLVKKMRFVAEDPEVGDEELYRQARELGLHEDDSVIRRILIQKMRLLAQSAEGPITPSEAEIEEYFAQHQAEWMQPDRTSLRHIFLSRDRRPDTLADDAQAILDEIAERGPEAAESRGDPFPLGHRHRARSEAQLAKIFGPDFARSAAGLEAGRWLGPVASAYGLHLVYVEEKTPAQPAQLDSVHNQVRLRLISDRQEATLERQLDRLRDAYRIQLGNSPEEARDRAS